MTAHNVAFIALAVVLAMLFSLLGGLVVLLVLKLWGEK